MTFRNLNQYFSIEAHIQFTNSQIIKNVKVLICLLQCRAADDSGRQEEGGPVFLRICQGTS